MAASLTSRLAPSFVQPALEKGSLPAALKPASIVSTSFGLKPCSAAKVSCSIQDDLKDLASKCTEAGKIAAVSLMTSALIVSGASAEGPPKRLSYDELQELTYLEVKGSGIANQCPVIKGGADSFAFKPGKYQLKKLCLEPTSFKVKAESQFKGGATDFQATKLMTRLTI